MALACSGIQIPSVALAGLEGMGVPEFNMPRGRSVGESRCLKPREAWPSGEGKSKVEHESRSRFRSRRKMAEGEAVCRFPLVVEGNWDCSLSKTLKNKLLCYFQSPKRSGGGECKIHVDPGREEQITVYFAQEDGRCGRVGVGFASHGGEEMRYRPFRKNIGKLAQQTHTAPSTVAWTRDAQGIPPLQTRMRSGQ